MIQRFGCAANLNIHLHCLVLDGVYRRTDGAPAFVEVAAPTDQDLQALVHNIIARLMKPRPLSGQAASLPLLSALGQAQTPQRTAPERRKHAV